MPPSILLEMGLSPIVVNKYACVFWPCQLLTINAKYPEIRDGEKEWTNESEGDNCHKTRTEKNLATRKKDLLSWHVFC